MTASCPSCRWLNGHGRRCPVGLELAREAAKRIEQQRHASRHWVRAVCVAADERTRRGVVTSEVAFLNAEEGS